MDSLLRTLLDTTKGGGLEFFGPFTENEALEVRQNLARRMVTNGHISGTFMCEAVELLHFTRHERF